MLNVQFTVTPQGEAVLHSPKPEPGCRFDAEFIERRMREHNQWRAREEAELKRDIIAEVLGGATERKQ